jgi:hypothetical protein
MLIKMFLKEDPEKLFHEILLFEVTILNVKLKENHKKQLSLKHAFIWLSFF